MIFRSTISPIAAVIKAQSLLPPTFNPSAALEVVDVDVDEVVVPLAVPEEAGEALEGSIVVFEMDVGADTDVGAGTGVGDVDAGEVPTPIEVPAWEEVESVRDGF